MHRRVKWIEHEIPRLLVAAVEASDDGDVELFRKYQLHATRLLIRVIKYHKSISRVQNLFSGNIIALTSVIRNQFDIAEPGVEASASVMKEMIGFNWMEYLSN